jgi:hypothetical protein
MSARHWATQVDAEAGFEPLAVEPAVAGVEVVTSQPARKQRVPADRERQVECRCRCEADIFLNEAARQRQRLAAPHDVAVVEHGAGDAEIEPALGSSGRSAAGGAQQR